MFCRKNLSILFIVALLVTPALAADIAGNGGFEVAGGGGATDSDLWSEFAANNPGSLTERDSSNPNTGSWAHRLVAAGADGIGDASGIEQNSIVDAGLPSLQENTNVIVSYNAQALYDVGGVGFAFVRILNGVGAIVADSGLQNIPAGPYQAVTLPTVTVPAFGAPPNDVYAAFVSFQCNSGGIPGTLNECFIDDVAIDATLVGDVDPPDVPMTSGWGLAAMGLLLLAAIMGMVAFVRSRPVHTA